jgi:hypothetical protein
MKAFPAQDVAGVLVGDRKLMERYKKAAAEEKLIAKSKDGRNWVLVLDDELAQMLEKKGLKPVPWEDA